jgi:hypothetical protein
MRIYSTENSEEPSVIFHPPLLHILVEERAGERRFFFSMESSWVVPGEGFSFSQQCQDAPSPGGVIKTG